MDIVEWLRERAKSFYNPMQSKLLEAANEIERLREALKDINGQIRQADRYLLKESTLVALKETE